MIGPAVFDPRSFFPPSLFRDKPDVIWTIPMLGKFRVLLPYSNNMKKHTFTVLLAAGVVTPVAASDLIAYWSFDTLADGYVIDEQAGNVEVSPGSLK